MTTEYLTLAEIDAKFPNSWVQLTEPKVNEKTMVLYGGKVLFHAPTRPEFDRMLAATPTTPVEATYYNGPHDENLLISVGL